MRQHAGSFFFQWSTVLRIGACAIQRKQADVLLGYVLGTCTPPLLMLPRWMTLRKSLVSRPVRTIRVSRGGLEPRAIRLPGWRHSRNRRGRWEWGWLRNTKILNLIKPCSPSNWSVRTSGVSPRLTEIKKFVVVIVIILSQALFKHNQTCFDTYLAFSRSCWVLICTRWNLQLLQSKGNK